MKKPQLKTISYYDTKIFDFIRKKHKVNKDLYQFFDNFFCYHLGKDGISNVNFKDTKSLLRRLGSNDPRYLQLIYIVDIFIEEFGTKILIKFD
jgi:hypothetical protein